MNRTFLILGTAAAGIILVTGILLLVSRLTGGSTAPQSLTGTEFGVGDSRTVTVTPSGNTSGTDNTATAVTQLPGAGGAKIFKIADGPITTATLVQTGNPTTTLARYVLQENGHVFDQVIDSAGAVPHAVSNTTIPGTVRGVWLGAGGGVLLQYLDGTTVKTVDLGFPPAATSTISAPTRPVHIAFLPDNIEDVAGSPDGSGIAYLLANSSGTQGYTAKADGTGSKALFSAPFSETLISWPAPSTLLLGLKSALGVPGAAFSVAASSGNVVPILYASGLTAIADRSFTHIIYSSEPVSGTTYSHNTKTNVDTQLPFAPIPEKCIWGNANAQIMYCAAPTDPVPADYLDLWHQGTASSPDTIFSYDFAAGGNEIVATPGTADGGVLSDIAEMNIAPDDSYLVFIKKGDRSLWGVRLR